MLDVIARPFDTHSPVVHAIVLLLKDQTYTSMHIIQVPRVRRTLCDEKSLRDVVLLYLKLPVSHHRRCPRSRPQTVPDRATEVNDHCFRKLISDNCFG